MNSFTQSILVRYGIDFTCYEPKSLRRRIIRVMNLFNIPSIHDLWVQFLHDAKFIQIFMNEISVGMTSMFRDPQLWRSLKSTLNDNFKNASSLSIWHAGCSTGEEVYSMGILLSETHLQTKAKALATDINQASIKEAQEGSYHKIKMIENESNYREFNNFHQFGNYYSSDGKHVTMSHDLIKHVTFQYHNLTSDPFPGSFDIIFCRNVMIYFDNPAKQKLVEKFYNALNPGGYFIIGYFDTLINLIDNKKFIPGDSESRIFKKN